MNEWGVPDWRDPAPYDAIPKDDLNRWRWEFFRRRADLRADFDRILEQERSNWRVEYLQLRAFERAQSGDAVQPSYEAVIAEADTNKKGFHDYLASMGLTGAAVDPNAPGFTIHSGDPHKYGYVNLPNPRVGAQPADVISPLAFFGWEQSVSLTEGHGLSWERGGEPVAAMSVGEGFVAIKFNLRQSIPAQLESARTALLKRQRKLKAGKFQTRNERKFYARYLRVLDAEAAGFKYPQIEAVLAVEDAKAPSAEKSLKAARKLQERNF